LPREEADTGNKECSMGLIGIFTQTLSALLR